MTETLLSLISIAIGILGAYTFAFFYKKYSFGFIGNTIIGVFATVFIIKSFGRIGFNVKAIMAGNSFHLLLFLVNLIISFASGALAVFLLFKLKKKVGV